MKPEHIKNAPKLFCENIRIGQSPEYFVIALSSGAQASVYSLTPGHAKRLLKYLSYEIDEHEKKNGAIETSWEPLVKSPLQRSNPPSEQS